MLATISNWPNDNYTMIWAIFSYISLVYTNPRSVAASGQMVLKAYGIVNYHPVQKSIMGVYVNLLARDFYLKRL
jgi:hypothetical protein